jgi:hypothetical protein
MWWANIIAGLAVFLLGVATAVAAWLTLPYSGEFGPGPGFVPLWLGIALALCAVPVVVADARRPRTGERRLRPETAKSLKVLVLILAVFLVLPVLGFPAGLALITVGGMRIMGRHGWLACAVTAAATAVAIHYLFGQWLGIPLPKGVLGW